MGIFADQENSFTYYRARLQFRSWLIGGTPRDPKKVQAWLRAKAGVSDVEELRQATARTLREAGVDVLPDATFEEMEKASEALADELQTNGFKSDANGLYIEGRTVKSMIKECVNIRYAGDKSEKWGRSGNKGAKSYVAEHVFIAPERIYLGRKEADGIHLFIGHTTGPRGPQSNLTYYQYVNRAQVTFIVKVFEDGIAADRWPVIWTLAEENGLGSLRSQENGKFDIIEWTKVDRSALTEFERTAFEQVPADEAYAPTNNRVLSLV